MSFREVIDMLHKNACHSFESNIKLVSNSAKIDS